MKYKGEMLDAIHSELEHQKDYLDGVEIQTIYFGGGTPSVLDKNEIERILFRIKELHTVSSSAEITLEANPDDLSKNKLKDLFDVGINRLSIGIQSFFDEDLIFMNRAHNAKEAKQCIHWAKEVGIHDITIDLIYGSPTTSHEMWQENLDIAFGLDIPHISSYCLTVEPQTALDHFIKKGKVQALDEEKSSQQFDMLMFAAKKNNFEHYEVSNFAKIGKYSQHNTSYWQGKKYLGIGPSAHSYNGISRQWNIAHNAQYIKKINSNEDYFEIEQLSEQDQYNEYIMTSLRTQWGCALSKIPEKFKDYFLEKSQLFIQEEKLIREGDIFIIPSSARFLSDGIAAEMFWVD